MKRREVLKTAGFAISANLFFTQKGNTSSNSIASAEDLNAYLRSLVDVKEPSVDRVVVGDAKNKIHKIGIAWMPYWSTQRQAVEDNVNVMVVHEPTFYTHWDLDDNLEGMPQPARTKYMKLRKEKMQWILDHQLTIIRCHDVLDKLTTFGIPFAFGEILGFKKADIIRSRTYYNVYKVPSQSAYKLAKTIAQKLKPLKQAGVQFYGDPDRIVSSVGLGTGCICDPTHFADLEPDLYIAIDDSVHTWTQTTYAEDTGFPLVVVNHGTSEENGMKLLHEHLQETFPQIASKHYPQGCGYTWISA